jgi:putative ABC transport system permease protein
MNLLALIRISFRALWANKLRSSLTILGMIIGVGSVITTISVGAGARARLEKEIELSLGSRLIIVRSGSISSSGVRLGFGSKHTVTDDDAFAIEREVAAVQAVSTELQGKGQVAGGDKNWATSFTGVTSRDFEIWNWEIVAGRGIEEVDVKGSAKVVVLGDLVAWKLFGDEDAIGQVVRINKVPLTVVGVSKRKGESLGEPQADIIHMPISTARNRILGATHSRHRTVNAISVKVREDASMAEAEDDIRALLRQRHRLQPEQGDDFTLQNLVEVQRAREESNRIMTLLLVVVASVSLLVGGIGTMNIMLVSVTERTREIGLRMAVGARGHDIFTQYLAEAITLALIGGLLGIFAGIPGSYAIAHFMNWPIALGLEAIALAMGFTAAIGIIFGLYPARKASRLTPIEALRYE